jgi:membrane protease YdiL (CAAX protease family)
MNSNEIPDNIPDDQNPLLPESIIEPPVQPPGLTSQMGTQTPVETHVVPSFEQPPAIYSQYPEDLRVPWGWFDLALLVVVGFLGVLVMSILMVLGPSLFGIHPGYLQDSASGKSILVILTQTLLSLALLGYLFVHIRARFESPFWRTIGWRPLQTGTVPRRIVYLSLILGGFTLSLFVQIASAAFQNKAKLPIQEYFQDPRSALLLMIMSVLLAPLVEETIFRGYIYPVVARSFGIGAGVLITGTLFGLLHAPQLWGGWGQILLLIGVGIIFTAARAVSNTVLASYVLHVSYNSFLFIAFLLATHGLRKFPAGP